MFSSSSDRGPPPEQPDEAHRLERTAKLPVQKNVRRLAVIAVVFVLMVLGIGFIVWRQNAPAFSFSWMEQQDAANQGYALDRSALGLNQKPATPDLGVAKTPPAEGGELASALPLPTTTGNQQASTRQEDQRPGWQQRRPDFSFKTDPNWAMWQYRARAGQGGGAAGQRQAAASDAAGGRGSAAEGGQPGQGGQGSGEQDGSAEQFYSAGNTGSEGNDGLDHRYSFRPELKGCVLKAADKIRVQSEDTLEATLPGEVTLKTLDPVWGKRFLRGGRVERCLWAPPASTMVLKANVQGRERGQVRVQVCATRLDKRGGGRINLGCMNGYDRDGSSGLRAESDRDWSGAITGLLFEAALSAFDAFGNSIGGGNRSPVTVALGDVTQGTQDIGREFIYEELRKPPRLTVYGGNVFYIKANADISDIPQTR